MQYRDENILMDIVLSEEKGSRISSALPRCAGPPTRVVVVVVVRVSCMQGATKALRDDKYLTYIYNTSKLGFVVIDRKIPSNMSHMVCTLTNSTECSQTKTPKTTSEPT